MKSHLESVNELLKNKGGKVVSFQLAPAVRVAIGEYFGQKPGVNFVKQTVSSLRKLGADFVFDTNIGADITIMEEANELVHRLKNGGLLPMFTTCCPTWYMYVERLYPELIPYLSSVKSPQAILASLIRTFFCEKNNIDRHNMVHIVIAPCLMKKEEAEKKILWVNDDQPNIDYVLTTKEFAELLKMNGIDLVNAGESEFDNPLGESSGAGAIFGTTGGVMEAALRTAHFIVTGKNLENYELTDIRNTESKKTGVFACCDYNLRIMIVNSIVEVKPILDALRNKESVPFDFIEVMNCPKGCIGGPGQFTNDPEVLMARRNALFDYDKEHRTRSSHENPFVLDLYKNYFGMAGSEKARHILHTKYIDRSTEDSKDFTCKV